MFYFVLIKSVLLNLVCLHLFHFLPGFHFPTFEPCMCFEPVLNYSAYSAVLLSRVHCNVCFVWIDESSSVFASLITARHYLIIYLPTLGGGGLGHPACRRRSPSPPTVSFRQLSRPAVAARPLSALGSAAHRLRRVESAQNLTPEDGRKA